MSANPTSAIQPFSLAETLERLQEQMVDQLPQALHARLTEAIDDLIKSGPARRACRVGEAAPDFTLSGLSGESVTLSEQLSTGRVVLMFYRGSWCPYCDLTLRAYSRILPELRRFGARLIAVSPQHVRAEVPNADEHRTLGFPVLSDVQNSVSRQYGLLYSVDANMRAILAELGLDLSTVNGSGGWELPVPATYVVAREGTIRWAYVEADYRLRAEPSQVLRALAEL